MIALWQRNVIGGVVAAASLAMYLTTEFLPDWSTYRHSVVPALVVQADHTGTSDGQAWRLASVRHLDRNSGVGATPLPANTVLAVVSIERSGTQPAGLCVGVITNGQQRWQAQGIAGFTETPPDGATGNCTQPGPVQFTFLLPRDVVPTAVDVTDFSGRILARLTL
jgi:hypothetical protein